MVNLHYSTASSISDLFVDRKSTVYIYSEKIVVRFYYMNENGKRIFKRFKPEDFEKGKKWREEGIKHYFKG